MQQVRGLGKLNFTIMLTSALVFGFIAAILGVVLYLAGFTGTNAIFAWLFISLLFIGLQWYFSPWLIKLVTGAKEVRPDQSPELHSMLARLAKEAGIPKPTLYVVDDRSPNAFAFGRTQSSSGIAVHTGLLEVLSKDEVEGVLAHEVGHIKHRDVIVMTLASALPVILYYAVLVFGGRDDRDRGAMGFMAVFLGAILARLLGTLLVMWLSRQREYYADAFSAYATRKPDSLMRALAKISYAGISARREGGSSDMLKSFYFASPGEERRGIVSEIALAMESGSREKLIAAIENEKKSGMLEIFMTHPLPGKRLEALLSIKKEIGG